MHSRRRFLAVAPIFGGLLVRAQQRPVPPSIASLPSMRGEVRPIATPERRARIAKAQQLMGSRKIDAILLVGGTSLSYFTGVRWGNSERLFAVVIPAKQKPFCVCPTFEEERAREQLNAGPLEDAAVLAWHEDENPYRLVAGGLRSSGISTGILGVDERTPYAFADGISQAAPAIKLVKRHSRHRRLPHDQERS